MKEDDAQSTLGNIEQLLKTRLKVIAFNLKQLAYPSWYNIPKEKMIISPFVLEKESKEISLHLTSLESLKGKLIETLTPKQKKEKEILLTLYHKILEAETPHTLNSMFTQFNDIFRSICTATMDSEQCIEDNTPLLHIYPNMNSVNDLLKHFLNDMYLAMSYYTILDNSQYVTNFDNLIKKIPLTELELYPTIRKYFEFKLANDLTPTLPQLPKELIQIVAGYAIDYCHLTFFHVKAKDSDRIKVLVENAKLTSAKGCDLRSSN